MTDEATSPEKAPERTGKRAALFARTLRRRARQRVATKAEKRQERDEGSLDWLRADLKAKQYKFKLAYETCETLAPLIDQLMARIKAAEPDVDAQSGQAVGVSEPQRAPDGTGAAADAGSHGAGAQDAGAAELPTGAKGDVRS